jgi:hypothetical protein
VAWRYAMPPVFLLGGGRRRSTGLAPVRSRRPTLEGCARNWSNGGYVRLNKREYAVIKNTMWNTVETAAVTLGIRRFWGKEYTGMVVGFKGKAGSRWCAML